MKFTIVLSLLILSLTSFASRSNRFPSSPDLSLTPGSLCEAPSEFRYPEQIAYCQREVNSWQKELVFINYRKIGFSLSGEREQYKIDHFIPLCLGGSNELTNLWPQYYTVYQKTDLLELVACEVLAKAKLTQAEVIDLVVQAKMDLTKVPAILRRLKKLKR